MKLNLITVVIVILICAWIEVPDPVSGNVAGGSYPVLNGRNANGDFFNREPVLVFETTGYSFLGAWHERLNVYTDGTASISRVTGYPGNTQGEADFTFVPVQDVEQLRRDLVRAGAAEIGDLKIQATDIPMSTVTFFARPGPQAASNTFNYYLGLDRWGTVNGVIDDFVHTWFPEF